MKKLIKDVRGVAALEFAMLFLPFFVFITILVEILLITYQTIAIDYANSEAAKYASTFPYEDGYERRYNEYIDSHKKDILFFLGSGGNYSATLSYCRDIQELYTESCNGSNDDNRIIIYEFTYTIRPLFLYNWIERSREVVSRVVLYSERNRNASTNTTT